MIKCWVYDIEVFPNYFCACFVDFRSNERYYFEISQWKNDRYDLIKFIQKQWLLGYNSMDYDNVIINYICKKERSNEEIYKMSQTVINGSYKDIKFYKYSNDYVTIDLMRLLFSKTQRASLKELQVLINWPKVQDLPKAFDSYVKKSEVNDIKYYCFNDTESTKAVAKKKEDVIKQRILIQKETGVNGLSKDDVNLGVSIFAKLYQDETGSKDFLEKRTYRPSIKLGDCINNNIKFKSGPFKDLLKKLKSQTIYETKGALNYNVIYGAVKHVYGTGGIHSKDKPGIIIPKNRHIFMDADVTSLYPRLWTEYGWCPEHLDKDIFIPLYKEKIDERSNIWKPKSKLDFYASMMSDMIKLMVNGSYGNLINQYSWLYDPMVAMCITLNGQLYLSMLSEMLTDNGFQIDSINTDGLTCLFHKSKTEEYYEINKNWENITKLELEYAEYEKVIRKDVNSYIGIFKDDKYSPKEKGFFVRDIKLGKGFDKPVIKKALYEYFVNGTDFREFIKNHDNIYDFCMMQKMGVSKKSGQRFQAVHNGKLLQKTNRFFASDCPTQGFIYKKDPGTGSQGHVLKDSGVTIFNDYEERLMSDYKINYKYYFNECDKIIQDIEPKQLTLF
jgi:hypothetical protein